MREYQTPQGRLLITLHDPATGAVIFEQRVSNLVTLAGRKLLAEMLTGAVAGFDRAEIVVGGPPDPDDASYVTPAAALENTALHHELRALPASLGEPFQLDDSAGQPRMVTRVSGTLDAQLDGTRLAMTEAGIQITKLSGTKILYNRVVFARITKEPDMQMTLTWEVIF